MEPDRTETIALGETEAAHVTAHTPEDVADKDGLGIPANGQLIVFKDLHCVERS